MRGQSQHARPRPHFPAAAAGAVTAVRSGRSLQAGIRKGAFAARSRGCVRLGPARHLRSRRRRAGRAELLLLGVPVVSSAGLSRCRQRSCGRRIAHLEAPAMVRARMLGVAWPHGQSGSWRMRSNAGWAAAFEAMLRDARTHRCSDRARGGRGAHSRRPGVPTAFFNRAIGLGSREPLTPERVRVVGRHSRRRRGELQLHTSHATRCRRRPGCDVHQVGVAIPCAPCMVEFLRTRVLQPR